MKDIAVKVSAVSKNFRLPHEKAGSVKNVFTGIFRLLSKHRSYETQHALKNVSFEIKKGEFFGIVGRNGSGKSTLLKMLAGIYQPTKGSIQVVGKLVPFIELGVGFSPELTGRENVYLNGALLGFSEQEIDQQYDDVVEFAELQQFMDQKLKNYSSGMQIRLAFSMAIRAKADILLIDEVLAVGDADFQRKCFDYFQKLKSNGTTVVFVTHDMNAVREYCDRVILIEKSELLVEGKADKVANEYTKMFIEAGQAQRLKDKQEKRWGDGAIKYTEINVKKVLRNDKYLVISLTAKAERDVENPNFGFSICNASRTHILGTNTRIKNKPIPRLVAGQIFKLQWKVPNIFNDGVYFVEPAIVYKGDYNVADWWEEATSFKSIKTERTPYIVNPSIECDIE